MKMSPKIYLVVILGCLLLVACSKKMPEDVIPPAEMENILYDYHLAQATASDYNGEERYKRELLFRYVFEKHLVTEAEFDSSLVWYTRDMEKLEEIYKNLGKRYEQANMDLAKIYNTPRKENKPLSGDSVNLWRERRMYLLTPATLTNKLAFEMNADTTFHALDCLVWEMKVNCLPTDSSAVFANLTLCYSNDSTQAVVKKLTREGMQHLTVKADTLRLKKIHGFVYYSKGISTSTSVPVVLGDILLMRYHASSAEMKAMEVEKERIQAREDSLKKIKKDPVKIEKIEERTDTLETVRERRRRTPGDLRRHQRGE